MLKQEIGEAIRKLARFNAFLPGHNNTSAFVKNGESKTWWGSRKLGYVRPRNIVSLGRASVAFLPERGKSLPSVEDLLKFTRGLSQTEKCLRYPSLESFAKQIGMSEETLIASFELENFFHDRILNESSSKKRRQLNDEVYTKAFKLYGVEFKMNLDAKSSAKDPIVDLFRKELSGHSILDVGCGSGDFLAACARKIPHKHLCGVDVFVKDATFKKYDLSFHRGDVVNFELEKQFDVAITDNVYEHIAPQDVDDHLSSIWKALKPGGKLIVMTPHRYFGPWDVTRILDNSYTGWTPARGTHINETTYSELASKLRLNGFDDLKTVHPKERLGFRKSGKRIEIDMFCRGERKPGLMRALQGLEKNYKYAAFEVCIIATKLKKPKRK